MRRRHRGSDEADAKRVFIGDEDVSGSIYYIDQASFPDGVPMGSYVNGQSQGFTTLPAALPN